MPKARSGLKGSSPKATKSDTQQSLSAALSSSSSQHLSAISGSTPTTNPPSEPQTPTPNRITTAAARRTPHSSFSTKSGATSASVGEEDSPQVNRPRRHIVCRLPAPSKSTESSPEGSQSALPPHVGRQERRRHVFSSSSTNTAPQHHASPGRVPSPDLPQHNPIEASTATIHSPRPSSPGSSTTNEIPADGSRQKAPFSSYNPLAPPESSRNGVPTTHSTPTQPPTATNASEPYAHAFDVRIAAPDFTQLLSDMLPHSADHGLDSLTINTPPDSPPMTALTGGSPHSRPGTTKSLVPVEGAMVEPEEDPLDGKSGCGSGTSTTNAAYCEPLPVAGASVSVNPSHPPGFFETISLARSSAGSAAPHSPLMSRVSRVSSIARTSSAAFVRRAHRSPSSCSMGSRLSAGSRSASANVDGAVEKSAVLTAPLFCNPLFGDAEEAEEVAGGCFSKLPDGASGDRILAKILSCLLDEDYPHSVWSGCFTPGKADLLQARCTSTPPGTTSEPLSHFPLDGRPNSGTRSLLVASSVCRRWRRVAGTHVIKHAAYFAPSVPPPPPPTVATQHNMEGHSLTIRSEVTGTELETSGSIQQGGSPHAAASMEADVLRWPVSFAAETVVCVLHSGALPFDMRSMDKRNLKSLCVLKSPGTPTHTHILHEYDAACITSLTNLSSLVLPVPSSRSTTCWEFLESFQNLRNLDICSPIGAPPPKHAKRVRALAPPSDSSATVLWNAHLPNTMHGNLRSLVATLRTVAVATAVLTQLTELRLCGPLEATEKGLLSKLSTLQALESFKILSPVAWATKIPGTLLHHEVVDTMKFAPGALSVLQCMPRLQALSLAGCTCISDEALAHVAQVSTLTSLDISVCRRLTDQGVEQLTALQGLRALDLSWCDRLGPHAATAVSKLAELEAVDMSGCVDMDDSGVFSLCNLKSLTELRLRGCTRVSANGLQRIATLPMLRSVAVSSESDQGGGVGCWAEHGKMQHVTQICFRGFKHLVHNGLECMASMHELREVTVDCCPAIETSDVKHLSGLPHLKKVVLRFCPKIDDGALMHLAHATALEHEVQELSLQGSTALYGSGLRHLSPLTRLHTLDLQQCTCLDVSGLSVLASLPRLLTVNVSKCRRIQGADFVHMPALEAHPHLVIVGLEGACLDTAAECGFKVASSPVAHM